MEREVDLIKNQNNRYEFGNKENPYEKSEYDAFRIEFFRRLPKGEQDRIKAEIQKSVKITNSQKKEMLKNDPDIVEFKKQALDTQKRAFINGGKVLLDILPLGIGEVTEGASWIAKIKKFTSKGKGMINRFDSTPDVSPTESLALKTATAPLEVATGGFVPSYATEAGLQFHRDLEKPIMKTGVFKLLLIQSGLNPEAVRIQREILDREIEKYSNQRRN